MTTNVIIANGILPGTTGVTSLYTSPANSAGTRIIAFTAADIAATTETYSAWIVPSGGSADSTNKIIPSSSLAPYTNESPPEVQNQLIPPGGQLYVQVSTASTINFRITGIQF